MNTPLKSFVIIAYTLCAGLAWSAHAQTTLKLHGSTTVKSALLDARQADLESQAGVKLEVAANGSGRGLTDLAAGTADVAMISSPLEALAKKINDKTPGAFDAALFRSFPIGQAKVAFALHPSNPVKSLTPAQVTGLLTGAIKNWQEVGGADAPVVVVVGSPGDGLRTLVEDKLLKGATFSPSARTLVSATQVPMVVSQFPGAIGVISTAHAKAGIVLVQTDAELSAPLFLVTKGEPSEAVTKLVAAAKAILEKP
jgi:phosphate transport system substrate-binding protein